MEKYVVKGGGRLEGLIAAGGAKNSVLKLMAASLMADGPSVLRNVPDIADVRTMMELLGYMGLAVEYERGTLTIRPASKPTLEAPYNLVQRMRASVEVLGALLTRYGYAKVAMPGGCNIGSRQIDLHLKGLSTLGAGYEISHGYIEVRAGCLKGSHIYLDYASVGATETLLMAATMAKGVTVIENAAKEPEIEDLARFLLKMGARVSGAGTSTIEVEGVDSLAGAEHEAIGDRIVAGTFLIGAAVTRGRVEVTGVRPSHLEIVLEKLREAGCSVEARDDSATLWVEGPVRGVEISTLPYPGFPTDLQPQMLVLLATADEGTSFVTENIFDNRFMVVDELNRLNADIKTKGHHAIVRGVSRLSGAPVTATDLRAGAALVLAGLVAEGSTEVYEIHHIDRGYERFEDRLRGLGADIERVREGE